MEFSIKHYAPELCHLGEYSARLFLKLVVERSARLCASWMAAGFVHGVLNINSDNMNVTGESFDYGPYRFLPAYDPTFTAAYFDHLGLYAYGKQPAAVRWNLHQLAVSLELIVADSLQSEVARFESIYERELDRAVFSRRGVQSRGALANRLLRKSVL